jgi:hypothetical protein
VIGFERRRNFDDYFNTDLIGLQGELDNKQIERLKRIRRAWNFYEGYHWEEMPDVDTSEITINYCRAFVNKFVAFELGKAFTMSTHQVMEEKKVTPDGRTSFEYLEDVWEDNDQYRLCTEFGQMKSVTGEAWLQVRFFKPEELDDPYNEYPQGRVRIMLLPTSVVFPEFDPHDRDKLTRLTIMYRYEKIEHTGILGRATKKQVLYKQIWTKDSCAVYDNSKEPEIFPNRYGIIPFVLIKNVTIAGRSEGVSDLDDVIPLNVELNMKESNVSEIIDYHAAPITIVYGAKVGNLEKGANKMWGGLSKDARVENLELKSDLGASSSYISGLKLAMCEVGGIPETVLGGAQAISNTSGVALQYINLPLIEKTRVKKMNTENGLEEVNKLILLVSLLEGLIRKPADVTTRDFFYNECTIPDTLPKDTLMELQQIQQEMKMGIETRKNAARRMGKENIDALIAEVDKDMKENPQLYGVATEGDTQINSGMLNGQTTVEQVRTEMTGQNGGQSE